MLTFICNKKIGCRKAALKVYQDTIDHLSNISEKCKDEESEESQQVLLSTYAILLMNEVTTNHVLHALSLFYGDREIYRQNVKRKVNAARDSLHNYIEMVEEIGSTNDLISMLDQYTDHYEKALNQNLKIFLSALKLEMDLANVPKSELRAQVEFTSVLLDLSLQLHELIVKTHFDLRLQLETLEYLKLTKLQIEWHRIRDMVNGSPQYSANLNTERCQLAYQALWKQLQDYQLIANIVCTEK